MNTPADKKAFVRLIQENKGIIWKICNSYCRDEHQREDLAQDIIYQLWKSSARFDKQYKFSTWMYRVALNVAISHYRKENRSKTVIALAENHLEVAEKTDGASPQEDNIRRLQKFINELEESKILNLQSWALNLKSYEMMQQLKATSKLNKLVIIKILVALLGLIWVAFLLFLVMNLLYFSKIFFIVSASAIAIITFAAVIVYIKHIIVIRNINNAEAVVDVQKKIASLQASTIQITRILFLQSPFYCTWFVSVNDVINGHPGFWFVTFPITILFTMASIWLYRNIDIRNKDKKWFKLLFSGAEWTYLVKAEAFINEIDTFKANN